MLGHSFLLTALVVILIPGTGVLLTISTGLALGRRASALTALGCTLGIIPHLVATIVGLTAVMHAGALAFQTLRWLGVAYLFYLSVSTWKAQGWLPPQKISASTPRTLILKAILLNVLNPKLTLFFLAFLPQFIRPDLSAMEQLLVLSLTFMLMTLVVFLAYGYLAHLFRKVIIDSPRIQKWLQRGFAACFAALATELAFTRR